MHPRPSDTIEIRNDHGTSRAARQQGNPYSSPRQLRLPPTHPSPPPVILSSRPNSPRPHSPQLLCAPVQAKQQTTGSGASTCFSQDRLSAGPCTMASTSLSAGRTDPSSAQVQTPSCWSTSAILASSSLAFAMSCSRTAASSCLSASAYSRASDAYSCLKRPRR